MHASERLAERLVALRRTEADAEYGSALTAARLAARDPLSSKYRVFISHRSDDREAILTAMNRILQRLPSIDLLHGEITITSNPIDHVRPRYDCIRRYSVSPVLGAGASVILSGGATAHGANTALWARLDQLLPTGVKHHSSIRLCLARLYPREAHLVPCLAAPDVDGSIKGEFFSTLVRRQPLAAVSFWHFSPQSHPCIESSEETPRALAPSLDRFLPHAGSEKPQEATLDQLLRHYRGLLRAIGNDIRRLQRRLCARHRGRQRSFLDQIQWFLLHGCHPPRTGQSVSLLTSYWLGGRCLVV
jgi:hypothetical protein